MTRAAVAALSLALGACAAPVDGLWPPAPGDDRVPIRVLSNGYHSLLFIPDSASPPTGWREWSFGEWDWYRADETTCGMVLPAMLWPTRATVHVVRIESLEVIESAPPEVFTKWRFDVTREGHERLLAWVRATRVGDAPTAGTPASAWYDATESYHLFGHCNHWTAAALREAGLPVWSAYALCHTGLAWQLDRAEGLARTAHHRFAPDRPSSPISSLLVVKNSPELISSSRLDLGDDDSVRTVRRDSDAVVPIRNRD